MKLAEARAVRRASARLLRQAGLVATRHELDTMEVADFALNDIRTLGLQLITYENNDRYCAKEIILLPRQTCPEHRHPPRDEGRIPGKRETFRCRWGTVYLHVPGTATRAPKAKIPERYRNVLTVGKEIVLKPGDQYTLPPDTLHWFQAGPRGAVVSEFSSTSDDPSDIFTDPNIHRAPAYE
jgi:D-lyxose ketol-isomerase